jgi:nucleotide-binding universal stress UspA family protein
MTLYHHILIATDGSELAAKAVDTGLAVAKALGARVTVVNVTEPWSAFVTGEAAIAFPYRDWEKACVESSAKILMSANDAAARLGVACATVHIKEQHPAEGILQAAEDTHCDLIVMSSHGRRGVARLLLGSQALRVLTHSTRPVLICR